MKTLPILLSLGFALSFTSCTSYYYSQLSSNNIEVEKANDGKLVIENDTVSIAYSFYGENAPITISIFNKINKPLYVDWSKSAIIIDDVATAYKDPNMNISGSISSSGYSYGGYPSPSAWRSNGSESSISGSVTIPNDAQFIPPKAKIINTPLELTDFPFEKYAKKEYAKKNFYGKKGKKEVRVLRFTEENSPLNFRSFLTIYDATNPSKPMVFEQEFYISELIKAGSISPDEFSEKPENTFYVKREKGKNAGAITAVVAIAAAGLAIDIVNVKNGGDITIGQ